MISQLIQMNKQSEEHQVKAVILVELEQTYMHRLVKNEKTMFTSGSCKIAKLQNSIKQPIYFINLNSFYYTITKDIFFLKMIYPDTVSYVFPHFDNGLSSLTLLTQSQQIHVLDQTLANAATLISYQQALGNPAVMAKIKENCPDLAEEQIFYPDNVKKVINTTGKVLSDAFTYLGGFIKTGVEKAGSYLNDKVEPGQAEIQPETKAKWEHIKQGTSNFLKVSAEYANMVIDPVVTKTKEISHSISEKIDHSQNENVKYAKQLALASGKAVGQAFDGFVHSSVQVGKEISEQGKKVIGKKYGEDVVDTIVGKEKEQINLDQKQNDKNQNSKEQEVPQKAGETLADKEDSKLPLIVNQEVKYPEIDKKE